jgi:hypothetical protein
LLTLTCQFLFLLQVRSSDQSPDLPPAGYSIFDYLIARNQNIVPYPFESLIDLMKREGRNHVSGTFIPNGRSLQRFVADNTVPRVIITGTTPNLPVDADQYFSAIPTDALFVALSEKANTLEVISYNESAQRFEFQLVTNYGPDLTPKIQYAHRELCISCHHTTCNR